jgi:hypothetical protein
MLLTPLLLVIALVACPVQDPPAEPAVSAVQEAEPATPSETPENVRAFLNEAQGQLYDPQAAGLTSLSFDVDVDMPPLGRVGSVRVTWAAGQAADASFTAAEGVALPPQLPAEVIAAQATAQAQQFLGNMLNRPIASLLDAGVATMAGVQEGLVAVRHDNPMATSQGVKAQFYLFDEDNRLQKSTTELEQQAMGASMTINMSQTYAWRPVEGTELLVPDKQTVEVDLGMMGKQTGDISYTYAQSGAIVLPVRVATHMMAPPMLGGEQTQTMLAKNLVVNGEPVARRRRCARGPRSSGRSRGSARR